MAAPTSPRSAPVVNTAGEPVESKDSVHGVSILKEIFPEHGSDSKVPILEQLLGSIATPARQVQGGSSQGVAVTCSEQMQAPKLLPPNLPPPPTMPPTMPAPPLAPVCQAQWQASAAAPMVSPGPGFGSYRERLRAGGRCAFQRSIDAGLVPRGMKQEWGTMPTAPSPDGGYFSQAQTSGMPFAGMEDGQQMWNQLQGNGWDFLNDQSQMSMQMPYVQDAPLMQQPQTSPSMQMMPATGVPPAPMLPEQCLQLPQMQMPQVELAQSPMAQMQMPGVMSGDSTPTDFNRCMSIVMPQSTQEPCDKDLLAAQLAALAADQCYED